MSIAGVGLSWKAMARAVGHSFQSTIRAEEARHKLRGANAIFAALPDSIENDRIYQRGRSESYEAMARMCTWANRDLQSLGSWSQDLSPAVSVPSGLVTLRQFDVRFPWTKWFWSRSHFIIPSWTCQDGSRANESIGCVFPVLDFIYPHYLPRMSISVTITSWVSPPKALGVAIQSPSLRLCPTT